MIDATAIESGDVTHIGQIGMNIQDHKEQLTMFVTKLGHCPNVLRIPWLQLQDVEVLFASYIVIFELQY